MTKMCEAYPRGGMDANTPRGASRVQFFTLDGVLRREKPCCDWGLTLCVPAVETVTQGWTGFAYIDRVFSFPDIHYLKLTQSVRPP